MNMSVAGIVVLVSVLISALVAVFWHARAYSLYRSLGERVGNRSYLWFSFELQNPYMAGQFPGYVDIFQSLPDDLAAQVSIVRRDMKRAELIIVGCWILLVVTLIGLSFQS
jgi:hypothetical protein